MWKVKAKVVPVIIETLGTMIRKIFFFGESSPLVLKCALLTCRIGQICHGIPWRQSLLLRGIEPQHRCFDLCNNPLRHSIL